MTHKHQRHHHCGEPVADHQQNRPTEPRQARPPRRGHARRRQRRITRQFLRRRRFVLGWCITPVLAAVVLTSCTTTIDGTPVPARGSGAQPAGEPPKQPRPPDRDAQAVTVALRQLDACAIFDLDAAKAAGNPKAALLPMGPHSCMLSPTANYNPATHGVQVKVGDGANQLFRDLGAPVTISGAKAYEYRDNAISKRCELLVPVSFARAITFEYDSYDDVDTCQVLRPVADAAVAKLANPDALTVDPTKRPGAAWDGCFLLAEALGQDAQSYTYKPTGVRDPFSGCETSKKTDQNAKPDFSTTPGLEVAYDQAPTPPKESRQIGGKVAEVRNYPNSCALIWNQAESGTGNQWFAALVVKLTAATCDTAAQLAEQVVHLFDQAPSDASAAPQRPLLYQPQDNDNPGPGACADFGPLGAGPDCEPYHEVSVPHGTDQIMQAAAANRNVQCAVFFDAVKTLFGPSFNALTWGAHCYFVEPTHSLQLRVNVDHENPPSDYGTKPDLWTDRQETQIAGKPAVTFWDTHRKAFDIYSSPYGDLARNGNVHIYIEARPGRGAPNDDVKLDPAKADTAKQVITQVTQKYFTE